MTRVEEAVRWGGRELQKLGLEEPWVEVEALLRGLLRVSRTDLFLDSKRQLSSDLTAVFQESVKRRGQREPVAYILGNKNFFGRDFYVNRSVLIPRPETELLVEQIVPFLKATSHPRVLEIGTGSGCIAVTLAKEVPGCEIIATDISAEAIQVAMHNAEVHQTAGQIRFLVSDLYSRLEPQLKRDFDIIVSNPPYISSSIISLLDPDLRYEPRLALDGGEDGLSLLKGIIHGALPFLAPSGLLALELGFDQGSALSALMKQAGFTDVQILKDLNRLDRIAMGKKSGSI